MNGINAETEACLVSIWSSVPRARRSGYYTVYLTQRYTSVRPPYLPEKARCVDRNVSDDDLDRLEGMDSVRIFPCQVKE